MSKQVYSTDSIMAKVWLSLVGDFRTFIGERHACQPLRLFEEGGIKALRGYVWPSRSRADVALFKVDYQLESLFKRYRFKDDVHTDADLTRMALEKFKDNQIRVHTLPPPSMLTHAWIQEARRICTSILGQYSLDEHHESCRFGKRACVGTPYLESYLDVKLGKPITGSNEHIAWFERYLQSDAILSDVISQSPNTGPRYEVCETLTLALVPKSYKAYRTILANTLIGSFATYGLGKVIQNKLLKVGLDIRRLQQKHGRLVKTNSRTRKLATADLSAASDSITRELLRKLLPCKWYQAVMLGAIPFVTIDGVTSRMSSVITMGMGHTFPLQTLVFYSLLKAIGNLRGDPNMYVSVYGDDLIYPSRYHRYVQKLFPKILLNLNGDKTYVQDHFRESCGYDFYRGCDVRPFQPQGGNRLLGRTAYASFCYKLLNGLLRRWDKVEIPETLGLLLSEVYSALGTVHQVPVSFPDGSGLRVGYPKSSLLWETVRWCPTNRMWVFKYLHENNDLRVVQNQFPYYWEKLRSSEKDDLSVADVWDDPADEPILIWKKQQPQPRNYRSAFGHRLRKLTPHVTLKNAARLRSQTSSIADWAWCLDSV